MKVSEFCIEKMDCPSEESLIRLKLIELDNIYELKFNLNNRTVQVYHSNDIELIKSKLYSLNLGAKLINEFEISDSIELNNNYSEQKKILLIVLLINFSFFLFEVIFGLISNSLGLIADSLDMLADAFVYGISLFAIGKNIKFKNLAVIIAGYIQMILAFVGLFEVLRRFADIIVPDFGIMIIVSLFALLANVLSLYYLNSIRSNDSNISASKIFTSNDVIINIGVIFAGCLVMITKNSYPDLLAGITIFIIVIIGSIRILKLRN